MTGIEMRHVPYRGGGQAINDVVAGHVPVYFADAGPAAPLIAAGKLMALGVTTATRASNLPDVPTLSEAGVPGYEANTWQMMVGPAHMPAPVVAKLNAALDDFMLTPQAQQHFISLGMQPTTGTPEAGARLHPRRGRAVDEDHQGHRREHRLRLDCGARNQAKADDTCASISRSGWSCRSRPIGSRSKAR